MINAEAQDSIRHLPTYYYLPTGAMGTSDRGEEAD